MKESQPMVLRWFLKALGIWPQPGQSPGNGETPRRMRSDISKRAGQLEGEFLITLYYLSMWILLMQWDDQEAKEKSVKGEQL